MAARTFSDAHRSPTATRTTPGWTPTAASGRAFASPPPADRRRRLHRRVDDSRTPSSSSRASSRACSLDTSIRTSTTRRWRSPLPTRWGFARRRARGSLNPRDPRGPSSDRSSPRAGPTRRRARSPRRWEYSRGRGSFPRENLRHSRRRGSSSSRRGSARFFSRSRSTPPSIAPRARRIGPDRIPLGRGTRPRDWTRGSW